MSYKTEVAERLTKTVIKKDLYDELRGSGQKKHLFNVAGLTT
jgi:hypothetical protein